MRIFFNKTRKNKSRYEKNNKLTYLGKDGKHRKLRNHEFDVSWKRREASAYKCFSSEDAQFYLLVAEDESECYIYGVKKEINNHQEIIGEISYFFDEDGNVQFNNLTLQEQYRGKHYAVKFMKAFLRSEHDNLLNGKNVYVHPYGGIKNPNNNDNELTAITMFYQRFGMVVCRNFDYNKHNPPIEPIYEPIENYTLGFRKMEIKELRINLEKEIMEALDEEKNKGVWHYFFVRRSRNV